MTDDRKSGIALIAGSIGGIVTMAIHPTGAGGTLAADQVSHLVLISGIAHSVAIMSMLLLFLGVCGLTRRLATPDRLAFSGLIVFGFATVAITIAATVSGFIVPGIMRLQLQDALDAAPAWHITIASIFQINQAFARIYTVAASVAMALWSASVLRNGGLRRGISIYGCVIAAVLTVAICGGFVKLNVHGMALVGLAQVIWFVGVGLQLLPRNRTAM